MTKYFTFYIDEEANSDDNIEHQKVVDDAGNTYFEVYNLDQCPEDAIIGRDLFTGSQYLEAVWLGMRLAKEGYEDIKYYYIDAEED